MTSGLILPNGHLASALPIVAPQPVEPPKPMVYIAYMPLLDATPREYAVTQPEGNFYPVALLTRYDRAKAGDATPCTYLAIPGDDVEMQAQAMLGVAEQIAWSACGWANELADAIFIDICEGHPDCELFVKLVAERWGDIFSSVYDNPRLRRIPLLNAKPRPEARPAPKRCSRN